MSERTPVRNTVIGQKVMTGKVERARELRREMTEAETLLWSILRRSQFCSRHFRRQQVIQGFIVDFYCHSAALIVEVDGPVHANQVEQDHERDQILASLGFEVLDFTNEQVTDELESVFTTIRQSL